MAVTIFPLLPAGLRFIGTRVLYHKSRSEEDEEADKGGDMGRRRRAILFSGLVMPGLGQWFLGQRVKAAVMMAAVFGLLGLMFVRIFVMAYRIMLPGEGVMPLIPAREQIAALHTRAWADNWWTLALIVVIWIVSVVDANREGKKQERGQVSPPQ
jgi:hypothetical protein